jgi:hypothetical protein
MGNYFNAEDNLQIFQRLNIVWWIQSEIPMKCSSEKGLLMSQCLKLKS